MSTHTHIYIYTHTYIYIYIEYYPKHYMLKSLCYVEQLDLGNWTLREIKGEGLLIEGSFISFNIYYSEDLAYPELLGV